MMLSGGERNKITLIVLVISLGAWLLPPQGGTTFPDQLANWTLMVLAMMTPNLIAPVWHICARSFRHLRGHLVALFCLGYSVVWIATGVIMLSVAGVLACHQAPAAASIPKANLAAGLGLVLWQCSPLKQLCLNRAHSAPDLAAFGVAAYTSAIRMGLTHGLWCTLSCWPLMALPLLSPHCNHVLMAVITLVVISERLDPPEPLRWKLRMPTSLMKWALGQIRTWLQKPIEDQLFPATANPTSTYRIF
jgi:predicted metal-binding membrane protein